MAFICSSMHSQEEEDYQVLCPFESTSPRKPSKRRHIFGNQSNRNNKNPYSDRGLDKFEALLADLDHKRQKILTQKGSEDVSMVKFIYRSPDEVRPIVVKLRDQRKHVDTRSLFEISSPEKEHDHQKDVALIKVNNGNEAEEGKRVKTLVDKHKKKKIRIDQWERKIGKWWKPSYYLPFFVILILVLLMFTTRSFAILSTSFGWYLVPIVNERLYNSKQPKKIAKKEYLKKSRDKKMNQ